MYKFLLAWRYLRSRYIALASIISVTLGVATLIVVNSVMAGFSAEMHTRLHSILSDIVIESPGLDGIYNAPWHYDEIRKVVGDELEAITSIVRVPAMLHFQNRGRNVNQQIMLIGVDEKTYADVSSFRPYCLHPDNQRQLSFQLHDGGYDQVVDDHGQQRLPDGGWDYRRGWANYQRFYEQERNEAKKLDQQILDAANRAEGKDADKTGTHFAPLPDKPPVFDDVDQPSVGRALLPVDDGDGTGKSARPTDQDSPFVATDPFLEGRKHDEESEFYNAFNPAAEQHTGLIIGIAVVSAKSRHPDTGEVSDVFFCLPGDDVQLTLPSSGVPPKPISSAFTVVDFYESKMSEYDSSFAFMPIDKLQELRGMIDPQTGARNVTSVQLKLKPGADLTAVRDKLQARFPVAEYGYRIQTWRDMQGPLLAAVELETTILNILLFLIIAVAGFGILATFFMIVVEKTRDIGVLKSLGAPSTGVMSIFLSYGLSLGAVGAGVGVGLGLLFVANIETVRAGVEYVSGQEVFAEEIYYFQKIPTIINPLTCVWVALGAMMIAVMASVLPSMRAARLHPVEALRYE